MDTQEAQLLQSFLDSLVQVRGLSKDREAEALIAQAVARQPDAAYLLVQRALLQDQAMQAAQARIAELERKVASVSTPASPAGSFLSGGGWGRQAGAAATPPPANDVSVTGRALPANRFSAQPAAAPRAMGGSFLPAMAATAAGVVGGAFLFQGIQHLMNRDNPSTSSAAAPGSDSSAAAPASDGSLVEGSFANDQYASTDDSAQWNDDAGGGDDFS